MSDKELNRYEKAVATKRLKYGDDFFKKLGYKGGKVQVPKGFSANRELARTVSRGRHKKGE